jgi:hypothetical protein
MGALSRREVLDFASLKPLSFENPLLEKVEEKGAYGGKAPVENKTLALCFAERFFHEVSVILMERWFSKG